MTLMSKNQTKLNFKRKFTYCIIRIKAEKVNIGFFNQSVAWKEGMAGGNMPFLERDGRFPLMTSSNLLTMSVNYFGR